MASAATAQRPLAADHQAAVETQVERLIRGQRQVDFEHRRDLIVGPAVVADARTKLHAQQVGASANSSVGVVGQRLPAFSSALRPDPLVELAHWGGAKLIKGKRVLDLGCGDGRFALGLAHLTSSVDGLDPDADAIRIAKKNARKTAAANMHFRVGAAQQLPYPDASFDVVLLSWTL